MGASNLGTLSKCTIIDLHAVQYTDCSGGSTDAVMHDASIAHV